MLDIFLAIIVGGAFGFALDRVGATNPGYIIRMLNFSNLHLMKTIFIGIGVGAVLLFAGLLTGIVDPGHLSVKEAYSGVFIGGLMLGAGFAIAGYCPGTGLTALATGRKDALFFVIGGLLGAAAYMLSFEGLDGTALLEPIAGGKATLGAIASTKYPALIGGVSGELIGLALGAVFIGVGLALPGRLLGKQMSQAAE